MEKFWENILDYIIIQLDRERVLVYHTKHLFLLFGFKRETNEVIVGEESELYKKEIFAKDINLLLIDSVNDYMKVQVKTRYSAKSAKALIVMQDENVMRIVFDDPQRAITPGQSVVFYVDDIVLGGGKIL